jgi:hypothetical protein
MKARGSPKTLAVWVVSLAAAVAPGAAATAPATATAGTPEPPPRARPAEYRLVVWFHGQRPLETFRYQLYDRRRGEDSPAIDAWAELMKSRFPAYQVVIRDIALEREAGETEQLKLGAVIQRELLAAAALQGIILQPGDPIGGLRESLRPTPSCPSAIAPTAAPRQRPIPVLRVPRAEPLGPAPAPFPVPLPYPRPHP